MSAAPTPAPWLKWPPDKKIVAGGLGGIVAWIVLVLMQHLLGFDPQAILVSFMGTGAPDVQLIVTGVITLAIAHFTTPSLQDVVSHVNNAVVSIAAADPTNSTTAVITTEAESDKASVLNAKQGVLPAESVTKMIDAGMMPPARLKVSKPV